MIKKFLILVLLIVAIFSFGIRFVTNPVFSLNQNTAMGFEYGTFFGGVYGWITNFGIYYNELEENMVGRFYLFSSKDSSQSINEVGYALSGENGTINWGANFKFVNYSDISTSTYLMNIGIGFSGEVFENVILGAFLDDFSVYSGYPGQLFKGNVGLDLIFDFGQYDLLFNLCYIKQEYFQFNVGGSADFDMISFGGYWAPEYYNKVNEFYNKVKGYFILKVGNLKAKVSGFYSFGNIGVSTVDLMMNYENHPYGYDVIIEVEF
ncbi:MAG: hypothetical protein H0Z24_08155 [Thermosipho sp. (in: Bacteria)]|nr:hypothetical protein [Thermosipho sp. (in: thermotogales)]